MSISRSTAVQARSAPTEPKASPRPPFVPTIVREPSPAPSAALAALNQWRFSRALPADSWNTELKLLHELERAEVAWIEGERAKVRDRAKKAPTDPAGFIAWFEELKVSGPGQNDPLFDWLESEATLEEMRWFLLQEVAGEAGFDDLVALSQLKLPTRPKLEMARNYWDEMGRGTEKGMHGPMLHRLAQELDLNELKKRERLLEAPIALANLMAGLAHHRRYAYPSIGALGVIELTAPGRAAKVYRGLKRLGVSPTGTRYFLLHSTLDVKHSESWNEEVLAPLVEENPACARFIAEGALLRLSAGARCFEAYRAHFGLRSPSVYPETLTHRRAQRRPDRS